MLHYTMAFDASGVKGGMVDLVAAGQASIGKKQFVGPVCLTSAVTAKDDLASRIAEAIHLGPEWKIVRAETKDGQLDFAATKKDPQAGKVSLTVTGMITPTTTDLLVTTDIREPGPGTGHIHTVVKQENSRLGDCPG